MERLRSTELTSPPSEMSTADSISSPAPVRVHISLADPPSIIHESDTTFSISSTSYNSAVARQTTVRHTDNTDNTNGTNQRIASQKSTKRFTLRRANMAALSHPTTGNLTEADISMILGQEDLLRDVLTQDQENDSFLRENELTRPRQCVCHPTSGLLRFWDFLIGAFLVVNFFFAVLVTAFSDSVFPGKGFAIYSIFRLCIHIIDFVINCRITFQVPRSSMKTNADGTTTHIRRARSVGRSTANNIRHVESPSPGKSMGGAGGRQGKEPGSSPRRSWVIERRDSTVSNLGGGEHSNSEAAQMSGNAVLITNPWEMLYEYRAQGWMWIDLLLAILPAELIYAYAFLDPQTPNFHPSISSSFIYFIFTLVLPVGMKCSKLMVDSRVRYNNGITQLKIMMGINQIRAMVIQILLLLFTVFLIAHVCGCIFYIIARFEEMSAMDSNDPDRFRNEPISWIYDLNMQNSEFGKRYVASLYWALVTVTSTGYGDVLAVTVLERAYNCIVTLFGALVYATIFGRVTVMFNTMAQSKDVYRRRLAQVNRFMAVYDLPLTLRKRIRRQVKFDWALTSGINVDDVIQQLPFSMQVEVRREILQESLEQIPVMQQVSQDTITALCMFFQIRQCIAGTKIIQEGDPGTFTTRRYQIDIIL